MLPERLRGPLERLEAIIGQDAHGNTQVHVPGANHIFAFRPTGSVWYGPYGYLPGGERDPHIEHWLRTAGLAGHPHANDDLILNHLVYGHRTHEGAGHYLIVSQHYGPAFHEPETARVHRGTLRIDPHFEGSVLVPQQFTHFGHTPDPELHSFIHSVLTASAPTEALVDYLADRHGVSHLIRPERYSREYDHLLGCDH